MIDIMVDLQGNPKVPLYQKIYEYIKKDMIDGRIPQGEKLPSTRLLAKNLSISRSTVELAYEQLQAEGYIKAEPYRGYFVCDIKELYQLGGRTFPTEDVPGEVLKQQVDIDFSPYMIDAASFPFGIWRRLTRNMLQQEKEELLISGDGQGEYALRQAIADYLHQARGVNCHPENMIIGAGNEYLELLLGQLLGQGKSILMENPGYPQAYYTFCAMNYKIMTADAGKREKIMEIIEEKQPDFIYVMPSHQFPLGDVMPLKQRLQLIKWATEGENRYLIEDDYDSEYRYRGKPIPAMQSVDGYGKVIYLGTFSRSIAPSLRISYMVLPEKLMEKYRKHCGFYSATVPKMQQEVLMAFLREGHFERHLNKMRGIYRGKRDFLLGELKKYDWVEKISADNAGLHVLVKIKTDLGEQELCRRAEQRGVRVTGLAQYDFATAEPGTKQKKTVSPQETVLLLGYGKLGEEQMKEGVRILDELLG